MTRFKPVRRWWARQHALSRLWPFCWDCRWAQQAWARGEFYAHDEPMWMIDEVFDKGEPVFLTGLPSEHHASQGQTWHWDREYGLRRLS